MKLTGVILARNEEGRIAQRIRQLSFCDEIILIDDYSADQTSEIAKKLGAKTYKHKLNNNFSAQRNFALRQAQAPWVLFIDADEKITENLKKEIINAIKNKNIDGYKIKRIDYRWGRKMKYGETGNVYLLRLAKKSKGQWKRKVHEEWDVKGNISILKNELLHYPEENLFALLKKTTRYTRLHGEELVKEGKDPRFWKIFVFPIGKFKDNLIGKSAYKDGWQGILMALIMSYHSFLGWGTAWWISKRQLKSN